MRRISLMLLCLLGLPLAGYAQGVTTAALTGTVTDERGDPLPGANVVAVHEPPALSMAPPPRSTAAMRC